MAAFTTIIAGIGVAAGIAGTVMQMQGQRKAAKAQERAERIRESQSNLETMREQRQARRQALIARATALSNASSQGADSGTGLQGGYGQVQGEVGNTLVASNQNRELGSAMFAANRDYARAQSQASFGSGISSLGGALVNNAGTIGRIGSYFTGNQRTA